MKLTDRNEGMQSLTELWESIARIANHVVEDNKKAVDNEYPNGVRGLQVLSLETLLEEIKKHHQKEVTLDVDKLVGDMVREGRVNCDG